MAKMKHPIQNQPDYNRTGTASDGVFVCDSSNPFDYETLTNSDKGKMGMAVQFVSRDGSDITVATSSFRGVIGNETFLNGLWGSGQAFALELLTLTITGAGYAIIYLKSTTEGTQP